MVSQNSCIITQVQVNIHWSIHWSNKGGQNITRCKLEQLECLGSQIPPATQWLPKLVIHFRSQSKQDKVKGTKKKKNAKNSNFEKKIQAILHATQLLKLLDKMYKYEMDPEKICRRYRADTGCGTDERMDRRSETNIPNKNFVVWWCE